MKANIIEVEIDDWVNEFNLKEPEIKDEQSMIALSLDGLGPTQVARLAITARHLGIADDDILPANKLLLNTGGAYSLSQRIAQRHKQTKLANGNTVKVREYVGGVRDDTDQEILDKVEEKYQQSKQLLDDLRLVTVEDEKAKDRALWYLEKRVIPNIRERLKIIAIHDPSTVKQVVKDLKKQIDVAVADLV